MRKLLAASGSSALLVATAATPDITAPDAAVPEGNRDGLAFDAIGRQW